MFLENLTFLPVTESIKKYSKLSNWKDTGQTRQTYSRNKGKSLDLTLRKDKDFKRRGFDSRNPITIQLCKGFLEMPLNYVANKPGSPSVPC